jgi:hypothetical protein
MDWTVRAMRLSTAIQAFSPQVHGAGLECEVRVSQVQVPDHAAVGLKWVNRGASFGPGVPLVGTVLTVTIWAHNRAVTFGERHAAHEQIVMEFGREMVRNSLFSVQLVG